jgi:hypothetical protein
MPPATAGSGRFDAVDVLAWSGSRAVRPSRPWLRARSGRLRRGGRSVTRPGLQQSGMLPPAMNVGAQLTGNQPARGSVRQAEKMSPEKGERSSHKY